MCSRNESNAGRESVSKRERNEAEQQREWNQRQQQLKTTSNKCVLWFRESGSAKESSAVSAQLFNILKRACMRGCACAWVY